MKAIGARVIPTSAIRVALFCPTQFKLQWVEVKLRRNKTVRLQITPVCGGRKVELRETKRAVTTIGGVVVLGEFLGKIGYDAAVRKHLLFRLTSPNAITMR